MPTSPNDLYGMTTHSVTLGSSRCRNPMEYCLDPPVLIGFGLATQSGTVSGRIIDSSLPLTHTWLSCVQILVRTKRFG